MLRVLQAVTCMDRGGLETMLMNYYRHIDRTRVQFDFLTHRAREGAYDKEIYSLGGKVFTVPRQNPFSPAYRHALHKFFSAHPAYTVVHAHLDCLSGVVLGCAKQHGVPVCIAHAHTTNQLRDFKYPIKDLYKRIIPRTATDLLACGEDAGRWMFGSAPFLVLPVAIDTEKFRFDKNMREDMRRTLGITKEELLIGHVGQFRKEKNQAFLLDVLHSLRACGTKSKLLFVGDGEKRAAVQNRAAALGLTPYVLFLGVREDVPALLHAMDVFCMPSLYEGMPLSVLEAQAAGLPCLVSNGVPKDCLQTPRARQLPLSAPPSKWAEVILAESKVLSAAPSVLQSFDICENAHMLTAYYLQKDAQKGGKPHMVLLTVFTPTYNRAHTLPEAYCSLKAQTSKNFLWLIVDDGSTDRTAALVSAWMQAEKAFSIRYLYRPNGGMHAAHNTAYAHIETELNLCLDSDDRLAKDAVEQIEKRWAQIKSKNCAGLIGLDDDGNGKLIGTGFPPGLTETTLSGYYAGGGKGDKKLVYRTDIIRKYPPYPEFPNEKYVALAAKYRLIDRDYKLAVLNRVLCHVTYLEDGSSHTIWKQYAKNPRGFLYWRQLCLTYPAAATRTVLDSIHYDAACFLAKEPALMLRSPKKVLTMLCTPLGAGLSVLIRLMAARTERKAQKEAV